MLGAVLLDERHLNALLVEEQLRAEHFYREQYGAVFAAMQELFENDRKIDHLTVAEILRQRGKLEEVGGAEAIDELAGWVPAAGHAREYGRIVREKAQMRALLDAHARDPVERVCGRGGAAGAARTGRALDAGGGSRRPPKPIRSIADILHEETERLHRLSVAKSPAHRHARPGSRTSTSRPEGFSAAT